MTFIERLQSLLREKGVSAHKMSLELGLGKNAYAQWRDRGTLPSGTTLDKLASYFGVTADYLLGRDEVPAALSSPRGYDALSDAQKEQIQNLIDLFVQEQKN